MDGSRLTGRRGERRPALVVLALAVLLTAVGIASSGRTPLGGSGARRPSEWLLDVALSLLLVVMAFGTVLVGYVLLFHRGMMDDVRAGGRGRRGGWAGLVTLLLFVGLLVATVRIRGDEGPRGDREGLLGDALGASSSARGRGYEPEFATWPVVVTLLVAGLGIAAAFVAHRARRRARAAADGESDLGPVLADVIGETLDDLRAEADPRRAVVAAYARMERVLAAFGLPRRPSEAPAEYLTHILARLDVGAEAAARLTALFERAKFSQHAVGTQAKEEAIETLETVRSELRQAQLAAESARREALRAAADGTPA